MLEPAGDLGFEQEPLRGSPGRRRGVEDLLQGHFSVKLGVAAPRRQRRAAMGMRAKDTEPLAAGGGRTHSVAGGAVGIERGVGLCRAGNEVA